MTAPLLVTGAMRQRIVHALPEIMQPTWLRNTWAGEHGSGGLRAQVTSTASNLSATPTSVSGRSTARGRVARGADEHIGTFTRDQTLHSSGRAEVHHSYMSLTSAAHGTGYARSFNDRAFARYAAAGVDDVTIHAALSVGGYAWARQGFELHGDPAQRAQTIRNIIQRSGALTAEDHEVLKPWLVGADGVVGKETLDSVQDLAAIPGIGRRALLRNDWVGQRDIPRTTAWWSKYDRSTRMDAFNGVSHLKTPELVNERVTMASQAISSRLPAPFNRDAFGDAIRNALGGNAHLEPGRIDIRTASGEPVSLTASHPMQVAEGPVGVNLRISRDRTVTASENGTQELKPALRSGLDDAYRALGVARVQSMNGETRTL